MWYMEEWALVSGCRGWGRATLAPSPRQQMRSQMESNRVSISARSCRLSTPSLKARSASSLQNDKSETAATSRELQSIL